MSGLNRRNHLSVKIPNVKLRPAPAESKRPKRKQREDEGLNAMDAEIFERAWENADDEETSTAALKKHTKPWKGIVITFTGVDNKPELSKMAKELCAGVENALTVNVTHVVASGYDSAKYLYAVENHLPVLSPSWIQVSHRRWLMAEDLDVQEDLENYKLLPFIGLTISISGIEPLNKRKQVISLIETHGGIYKKNLDRTCTHLISALPTFAKPQSEKVKWALSEIEDGSAKKRAGKRPEGEDLKIVYEEWFWDCIAFEGRWKEDYYDARKPRRKARAKPDDVTSEKVEEMPEEKQEAKEEKEELAVVKKRKRDGLESLVGDIISTTTAKTEPSLPINPASMTNVREQVATRAISLSGPAHDGVLSKTSLSPPTEERPNPSDRSYREPTVVDPIRRPSMLHQTKSTSFAEPSRTLPTPPTSTDTGAVGPENDRSAPAPPPPVEDATGGQNSSFFAGLRFSHCISEQSEGLERALVHHGGEVVTEEERGKGEEVDYIVVRLSSTERPSIPFNTERTRLVTECWIEGCCFQQKLLSLEDHLVFQPLPIMTPVLGLKGMSVHISGFPTETSVFLRRLLKALGGDFAMTLNRKTSHLVCGSPTGQKYEKGLEWGVQVVQDSWLLAIGRSGMVEPENEHRHLAKLDSSAPFNSHLKNRLTSSNSTSRMSMVSELDDTVDYNRNHTSSSSKPPTQVSQNRVLGCTPTHVDGGVLSPPKTETERKLNHVDVVVSEMMRKSDSSRKSSEMTEVLKKLAEGPPPNFKAVRFISLFDEGEA
ncbi:DNA replication regulator DPB11, partial [Tremellales sp. Uapishka_1]